MLIPEEEAFLTWMAERKDPVSMKTMRAANAPGYDGHRVQNLQKSGLLIHGVSVEDGDIVGLYKISDDGRRELLMLQESRRKEAEAKRQQRMQNKLTIIAPILTFFLGLLVERFAGIIEFFSNFFKNIC